MAREATNSSMERTHMVSNVQSGCGRFFGSRYVLQLGSHCPHARHLRGEQLLRAHQIFRLATGEKQPAHLPQAPRTKLMLYISNEI
ncbi:hypothetical protein M407DRAFT_144406 [Tulasnella calospora MUT 4182]|uniref:Uncharacterized protein n=1 Tax=Tulasnella calospora MUT 4182 TaxID=1051891 RepID=A0A0C3LAS3_9AGAM|nr:hypothetical protein M407DRAFT_144406 [Tulasnella calospora MUT 4182]